MQSDREKTTRAWRASAEQDLRIAKMLSVAESNAACYHAQQAGEKALKAALLAASDDIGRTHVLLLLLELLREAGHSSDPAIATAARSLDRYYMQTRYPDAIGDIDPARMFEVADAASAIANARVILAFADAIVATAFDAAPPV